MMAQALRLCAVSLLGAGALVALRDGLPAAAPPEPQAAACAAPEDAAGEQGPVRWISQQEAQSLVSAGDVAFIDCRSRNAFEAGHVAGSIHVPPERDPLEAEILARVKPARTVVTYCDADRQCDRSLRIAVRLAEVGLPDVRVLEGGMPAWLENGYPAESGLCPLCPSP